MSQEFRHTALVTGASRGIGRATAIALARDGYEVWLNYLTHEEEAKEVLATICSRGGTAHLLPFDVSDPEAIRQAVLPLIHERKLYALVLNAGVLQRGSVMNMEDEIIKRTLAVNLESFFYLARTVVRTMIQARKGRIVTVASIAGVHGIPGQACYAASKAGLIAATRSLAQEFGRFGILANAVVPGLIETTMSSYMKENERPNIPLGRPGTPDEVAEVIAFLCSARSSYINGAAIPVTGGLSV